MVLSDILPPGYAKSRLAELKLTPEDIRGESDPDFHLMDGDLEQIKSSKTAFDAWTAHLHSHKELKKLKIGPYDEKSGESKLEAEEPNK